MNFRQLNAFNIVMRVGTITSAAKHMRLSQPSVTRLIRDLELSLGFTLFVRQGRGITATVEARRFHQAVESAFISIDRLDDLAASIRKATFGKVSVGAIPTFSASVLPRVLGKLSQDDNETHIIIYSDNTPAIVEAVRLQQFDFGIVSRSPPYNGVHILYQTSVNYVALIPLEHQLADLSAELDLDKIAAEFEFVTFGNVYPLEMQGMEAGLADRFQKNAHYSVANALTGAALVREIKVPALIDPFSAKSALKGGGVMVRPIQQKLQYHIAVITRGVDSMTREARFLADNVISEFETDPIILSTAQKIG